MDTPRRILVFGESAMLRDLAFAQGSVDNITVMIVDLSQGKDEEKEKA